MWRFAVTRTEKDVVVANAGAETMRKGVAIGKTRIDTGKHGERVPGWLGRNWPWVALGVIAALVLVIRLRSLDVPLERDEGEYAYAGQLILDGVPPYLDARNMKLPGIYAIYALTMAVFGESVRGIHLGLIVFNLGSITLLFLLARRLLDDYAAVGAAAVFALLSASRAVLGQSANSEQYQILPIVAGLMLLLKASESRRALHYLLAGLAFGFAFVVKQQGAPFVLFGGVYAACVELRKRPMEWPSAVGRLGAYVTGAAVPYGVTCLLMLAFGVFDQFWFWTFDYARQYGGILTFKQGWPECLMHLGRITGWAVGLWIFVGVGFIAIACDRAARQRWPFYLSLLAFSVVAVSIGFYYRQHYFILSFPAVALIAGAGVSWTARLIGRVTRRELVLALLAVAVTTTLWQQRVWWFRLSPRDLSRDIYGSNPFVESPVVAEWIKNHSKPGDRILVFGSEPQIYFYANRRSATGYIYTYALMEPQKYAERMQRELAREVEAVKPRYIVAVRCATSWLRFPQSNVSIFDWFVDYTRRYYKLVGVADIVAPDHTEYVWGDDALDYEPASTSVLLIYERNSGT
jgi:hypothetical protein